MFVEKSREVQFSLAVSVPASWADTELPERVQESGVVYRTGIALKMWHFDARQNVTLVGWIIAIFSFYLMKIFSKIAGFRPFFTCFYGK